MRRLTFEGDNIMTRHSNPLLRFSVYPLFALSLTAYGAMADVLPVQNLTFTDFGPGGLAPKAIFTTTNVSWMDGR